MTILGISGFAGSGKDQLAKYLAPFGATNVALADPLKRIVRDVYDFTDEQLWGPSAERNKPDPRYPRDHNWKVTPSEDESILGGWSCACCGASREVGQPPSTAQCFLTPRYTLQLLGTEFGRHCFYDTWAVKCVRTAKTLLEGQSGYSPKTGLVPFPETVFTVPPKIVTISDVRFKNEMKVIREAGGKLLRVKRTEAGLKGTAALHPSESEQAGIPDKDFDIIVDNDGTLDDLQEMVRQLAQTLLK